MLLLVGVSDPTTTATTTCQCSLHVTQPLSQVADPFQAPKQRREAEVRALLDKLPPSMITVDPDAVGRVIKAPLEVQKERAREAKEANEAAAQKQR